MHRLHQRKKKNLKNGVVSMPFFYPAHLTSFKVVAALPQKTWRTWRPSVIFWEENASVEGGEHIAEVLEKRGWAGLEFYAFRQPTSISKEDRIGKLEPDFRAGNIIFPYDRWYKGYDGMERDLVQDFLNDEYLVMTRMRRRKRSFRREIRLHRRCQVARRATRGALRSKVARGCAAQTAKQSSARAAKRRSGRKAPRRRSQS